MLSLDSILKILKVLLIELCGVCVTFVRTMASKSKTVTVTPLNGEYSWWRLHCGASWVVLKDHRRWQIRKVCQEGSHTCSYCFICWTTIAVSDWRSRISNMLELCCNLYSLWLKGGDCAQEHINTLSVVGDPAKLYMGEHWSNKDGTGDWAVVARGVKD